jgi:hypothetical protein
MLMRERLLMRKRPTVWQWPPVRSFTLANVLRLLLGFWLLYVPMLGSELAGGDLADLAVQNQLFAGGCVIALAAMRIIFVREAGIFRWAHLLLGLWTIASPWVFDYFENDLAFWNSAVCGSLLALLATWSLVR